MLSPLRCIDAIRTCGEFKSCVYEKLGEDTDTLFFKRSSGEVVIAFCGSNSKVDWKNNFHFWKKAYEDADIPFTAHSGFLKCWKKIRHEVEDRVRAMEPVCITVTGHSYGGALAVLCSEDMKYIFPDLKVNLITFGAPRVIGWKNWDKIKGRWEGARQFRNGSDLVTCVPPFAMFFHHVVPRTCIGDKPSILRLLHVNYHAISEYQKSIEKISF